jgi:hypothetical protein
VSAAYNISMKLSERLAQITVANGYNTDIGLRVYRGKLSVDSSAVPCVILVEGDDEVVSENTRQANLRQMYLIEAHDTCDPSHPNDKAHLILSDLKRAIFGGDKSYSGLLSKLSYRGRSIQAREGGTALVAAGIRAEVAFVEDLNAP